MGVLPLFFCFNVGIVYICMSWDSLKLFAGGYLYNQLSVTKGAKLFDGTRSFWRFNYNGEFQQSFLDDFALNVKAKAQYTEQDFLPSSEQFQIGGVNSVRGYTEGMLVGDKGFAVMNELQYDIKPLIKPKSMPFLTLVMSMPKTATI